MDIYAQESACQPRALNPGYLLNTNREYGLEYEYGSKYGWVGQNTF